MVDKEFRVRNGLVVNSDLLVANSVTGNVGIGTTSPLTKLHVSNGHVLLDNNQYLQWKDESGVVRNVLYTYSAGEVNLNGYHATPMVSGVNGATYIHPSGSGGAGYKISVTSSGVGIGGGLPNNAFALDVNGNARITGNLTLGDAATDTVTINASNLNLANNVSFDSGTLYLDSTNNRVGIGTTTPTSNLTIDGDGSHITEIRNGGWFMVRPANNTWDYRLRTTGTGSSSSLGVYTGNNTTSPMMSFTAGGLVGIGTTTPTYKLDVTANSGGVRFDGSRPITFNTTSSGEMRIQGSAGGWALGTYFSGANGTSYGGFGAYGGNDALQYYWMGPAYNTPGLVVNQSGLVGVGTTAPSANLHVVGTANVSSSVNIGPAALLTVNNTVEIVGAGQTLFRMRGADAGMRFVTASGGTYIQSGIDPLVTGSSTNLYFTNINGAATWMTIQANTGNVGVGITTPTCKMDVFDDSIGRIARFGTDNANAPALSLLTTTTGTQIMSGFNTGIVGSLDINTQGGTSYITLSPANVERFRITKDGYVGIGTTTPQAQLQVQGSIIANDFFVLANSSRTALTSSFIQSAYAGGSLVLQEGMNGDFLAFNLPDTTELRDANTAAWSSTTTPTYLFTGRLNAGSFNLASGYDGARFTWNNFGYKFFHTLAAYLSTGGNLGRFIVEGSSDGVTWTTFGISNAANAQPGYLNLSLQANNNGVNPYLRITFERTVKNNTTPLQLYGLCLSGTYPANQIRLFNWDEYRNVTFANNVTVSNNVIVTNNVSIGTTSANQKLTVNGTANISDTLILGTNYGSVGTYKKKVLVIGGQGNNATTYELGRISRDSANWSMQFIEITVYNSYYRSGKTTWNITYNQVDAGTVTCQYASGTIMHKVYLGDEVVVSGTICYRPILIDLPAYTTATVDVVHGYRSEVDTITYFGQILFSNTYTANANAVAYSGDTHLVPSGGNVGIGTTSPQYKLDVNGTANISSTLSVNPGIIVNRNGNEPYVLMQYGGVSAGQMRGISGGGLRFTDSGAGANWMNIDGNGNVAIGQATTTYKLQVNGSFAANTKSFVIDHPTKPGMKLRYGSLEGPENGVYVRGRVEGTVIELPEHWTGLVHEDSITVQLTAIGHAQDLYVTEISNNKVYIDTSNHVTPSCFYTIYGERKDVEKLVVEF